MSSIPMFVENAPARKPQTLRDYQQEAVKSVLSHWGKVSSTLGTAATGLGKTTILAEVVRHTVNPATQRAVIIAHTNEIVDQIYERVVNQFAGELDRPYTSAKTRMVGWGIGRITGEHKDYHARIIVATRQSLHSRTLTKMLQAGPVDVFIIDEAHHAFVANTYGDIFTVLTTENPRMKTLGVTATPRRSDKKALGSMFNTIAFEYGLKFGIEHGYLVPALRRKIQTSVDTSKIRSSRGDYAQGSLLSVLEAANWLELAQEAFVQYIPSGTLTLAFLPTVEMSKQFADQLNEIGIKAAHVDGTTPKEERRDILRRYRRREITCVCNVAVFTEGFDAPETGAVFLARPTRSEGLFTQIVGRGLRPYPGKNHCLLVDLSVADTRAVDAGSLLGGTAECDFCGAQYWDGIKVCPACGHSKPEQPRLLDADVLVLPETEEEEPDGVYAAGLVATLETLSNAWHTDKHGYMSCSLMSQENQSLLITPPNQDEYYHLYLIEKKRPARFINQNEDLPSLMIEADKLAVSSSGSTARKDAWWRNQPATTKQVTFAGHLDIKLQGDETRGQISMMIDHALVVSSFKNHPPRLI